MSPAPGRSNTRSLVVIGVADSAMDFIRSHFARDSSFPAQAVGYGQAISEIRRIKPSAVVIGLDQNYAAAIRIIPVARSISPNTKIIVAAQSVDESRIKNALRVGQASLIRLPKPNRSPAGAGRSRGGAADAGRSRGGAADAGRRAPQQRQAPVSRSLPGVALPSPPVASGHAPPPPMLPPVSRVPDSGAPSSPRPAPGRGGQRGDRGGQGARAPAGRRGSRPAQADGRGRGVPAPPARAPSPPARAPSPPASAADRHGLPPGIYTEKTVPNVPVSSPPAAQPLAAQPPAAQPEPRPEPRTDARAGRPGGFVTALLGVKGGCGTTLLAVNMAAEMAQGLPTCLLDFDFSNGDVIASLDISAKRTIRDALRERERLDGNMLRGFTACIDGRLYLLGQPDDLADRDEVDGEAVLKLIRAAQEGYPLVVIDGGTRLDEAWLTTALSADQVLLVCTPDVPAVRNARRRLHLLDRLGVDRRRVGLIVNRWHRKTQVSLSDLEQNLQIPVVASIALDERSCEKAQYEGRLLKEVARRSATNTGIREVASSISELANHKRSTADARRRGGAGQDAGEAGGSPDLRTA